MYFFGGILYILSENFHFETLSLLKIEKVHLQLLFKYLFSQYLFLLSQRLHSYIIQSKLYSWNSVETYVCEGNTLIDGKSGLGVSCLFGVMNSLTPHR